MAVLLASITYLGSSSLGVPLPGFLKQGLRPACLEHARVLKTMVWPGWARRPREVGQAHHTFSAFWL